MKKVKWHETEGFMSWADGCASLLYTDPDKRDFWYEQSKRSLDDIILELSDIEDDGVDREQCLRILSEVFDRAQEKAEQAKNTKKQV